MVTYDDSGSTTTLEVNKTYREDSKNSFSTEDFIYTRSYQDNPGSVRNGYRSSEWDTEDFTRNYEYDYAANKSVTTDSRFPNDPNVWQGSVPNSNEIITIADASGLDAGQAGVVIDETNTDGSINPNDLAANSTQQIIDSGVIQPVEWNYYGKEVDPHGFGEYLDRLMHPEPFAIPKQQEHPGFSALPTPKYSKEQQKAFGLLDEFTALGRLRVSGTINTQDLKKL